MLFFLIIPLPLAFITLAIVQYCHWNFNEFWNSFHGGLVAIAFKSTGASCCTFIPICATGDGIDKKMIDLRYCLTALPAEQRINQEKQSIIRAVLILHDHKL